MTEVIRIGLGRLVPMLLVLWACGDVPQGGTALAPGAQEVATPAEETPTPPPADPGTPDEDPARAYAAAVAARKGQDVERAARLYRRACEADHAQACFALAGLIESGKAQAASPGEGDELRQRACRGGSVAACDSLGH